VDSSVSCYGPVIIIIIIIIIIDVKTSFTYSFFVPSYVCGGDVVDDDYDYDDYDIVTPVYGEAVSAGRIRPDAEADAYPSSCPEVKNVCGIPP
jgi:hypothetical protein